MAFAIFFRRRGGAGRSQGGALSLLIAQKLNRPGEDVIRKPSPPFGVMGARLRAGEGKRGSGKKEGKRKKGNGKRKGREAKPLGGPLETGAGDG